MLFIIPSSLNIAKIFELIIILPYNMMIVLQGGFVFMDNKKTWFRSRMILSTYIVVIGYVFLNLTSVSQYIGELLSVISPFLYAIGIAFVFNMPMTLFEKYCLVFMDKPKYKKISSFKRSFAILLTILLIVAIFTSLILFVIPQLIDSVSTLIETIPGYIESLEETITSSLGNEKLIAELFQKMSSMWQEIINIVGSFLKVSLSYVLNFAMGFTSSVINIVLSLILAIYMLASKEKLLLQMKKIIYALCKTEIGDKILEVGNIANGVFAKFVSGQCIEAFILGGLCFVGMTIFSFPYALLISVIIGFTALIPVFGAFLGAVPATFIIFIMDPMKAIWFVVFIIVLQQIEGNLIYPRVVGNSVGLSAIWVLFAMMVGGSLFGFLGMLLSIPVFGTFYKVFGAFINKKLENKTIK